ncbi:MAG: hypothetical protein KDE10_10950, partial [Rhodobacteraceae bacterium]|nr:hypothetical protein [Paracoccaceae bacterium]
SQMQKATFFALAETVLLREVNTCYTHAIAAWRHCKRMACPVPSSLLNPLQQRGHDPANGFLEGRHR